MFRQMCLNLQSEVRPPPLVPSAPTTRSVANHRATMMSRGVRTGDGAPGRRGASRAAAAAARHGLKPGTWTRPIGGARPRDRPRGIVERGPADRRGGGRSRAEQIHAILAVNYMLVSGWPCDVRPSRT